jgi:hypothetical protein
MNDNRDARIVYQNMRICGMYFGNEMTVDHVIRAYEAKKEREAIQNEDTR